MASRRHGLTQLILAALLLVSSLQFAPPAQAKSFTVCPSGCDFTTIVAALQDADDGDVITVGEGTFAGGFAIEKNVDLRGAGRDKTTIQGTDKASVIRVGQRANVTIEGVTITGGGGSRSRFNALGGGGILNEGELTLAESVVRANLVANGEGGGIYSHTSKPLKILNSVIEGNQATDGGGVYVHSGDVVMKDTTVSGNRSTRNGGGIVSHGETLRLERCEITDNRADQDAGGVHSSFELVLIDSMVSGNKATNVGGVAGGRERLNVVGSTIRGNISGGSGGGIRAGSGGVEIVNSVVETNQSRANGAGIFASNLSGDVSLKNTTVSGNAASQNGGGILNDSSEITLDNSNVIDNRAGGQGGGIYSRTTKKGAVKLRNGSVVAGNQPDQCAPAGLRC